MNPKRPWRQNISLTGQTVVEHIVDDPIQLMLQISRRLPAKARGPVGKAIASLAGDRFGAAATVGQEIAGDRAGAEAALDQATQGAALTRSQGGSKAAHLADVALSMGDHERAERLLQQVPPASRRAAWYAAAARIALYRGDHDLAVEFASRHPRNVALARRMLGEQQVFAGYRPDLPAEPNYEPVTGRVLHVLTNSLPHTASGYAQRSHSILKSLVERGFEAQAVTRPGYPVQVGIPWAASEDIVEDIHYVRLLPTRLGQGLKARADQHAALLAAEVRRYRPAILHTTTHFTNAIAVASVAKAFGIPWVYEVRGQLADTWASTRGPQALTSQRYREFSARELDAAKSADAVVTLGENMKRQLVAGGVSEAKISVCPNAVGVPFINEPPTQGDARARLGLEPDVQLIGTVSSIVDYEGLDLLLRAAALLIPSHPRLRVRIAGDGVALPGLKVLAEELGIADRCDFPGRVQRAEAIWHHAALDVFVVPRKDLTVTRSVTPMKTVEASAVGRPVVASRLPALEELVVDGETGLLFEAENAGALADTLRSLLDDQPRIERMGANGREWALETRTWAANATTYENVYARLAR
ncbi:glycosyltransferase family 4 protein [Gulosibacter molinativorax]|uniref:D-inositol 3-phosphate glycosyltransferase n=1 Tax=Gulosibacter molinativorax TaxID=256821 RepID=A0ABT7C6X2_9MICO|nr:glycosyltransferase family 4 protein [Gulosibacter molinativorax]MDJ1370946.1 glycosyltransferase WbuB [Gulosibacter molinativorax]QUY62736.1 D-inositol 3-phosphate glycosyltransferase [Gulosibacter molinativorax]